MYLFLFFTVLPALYLLNLGIKWQKNIVKARKSGIEPVTVGRECFARDDIRYSAIKNMSNGCPSYANVMTI